MFMTPIDSNESTHAAIKATLKTIKPIRAKARNQNKNANHLDVQCSLLVRLDHEANNILAVPSDRRFSGRLRKVQKVQRQQFLFEMPRSQAVRIQFRSNIAKTETTSTSFEIVNTEGIVFVATLRAVEVSCYVI